MYLGQIVDYQFLAGTPIPSSVSRSSTNNAWVQNYQDRFNKGPLAQSFAMSGNDPVGAYNLLYPAFQQIQADAAAFVASYPAASQPTAQATIDGWKNSDFPMIQHALNDWQVRISAGAPSAGTLAPPASTQPTTILQDLAPVVAGPAPAVYTTQPGGGSLTYAPPSPVVNVAAPPVTDIGSAITEYLPWILGAVVVGFLATSGSRRKAS